MIYRGGDEMLPSRKLPSAHTAAAWDTYAAVKSDIHQQGKPYLFFNTIPEINISFIFLKF